MLDSNGYGLQGNNNRSSIQAGSSYKKHNMVENIASFSEAAQPNTTASRE